jgi:hypothetical protein
MHDHGREVDTASPAPGSLEVVRSFVSLHDHELRDPESLPPSPDSLEWWFRTNGLIGDEDPAGADDLIWAAEIQAALRAGVAENMGARPDPVALAALDRAAAQTELRVRFQDQRLRPEAGGVRGAVGALVGIAFLARLDGSWRHLKDCGNPTCRGVFFDRSKNHSGKWCSMQTCGNRAKVRAFRERRAHSR